jgi:hypothetical protein
MVSLALIHLEVHSNFTLRRPGRRRRAAAVASSDSRIPTDDPSQCHCASDRDSDRDGELELEIIPSHRDCHLPP